MATEAIRQDHLLRDCQEQIEQSSEEARRLAGELSETQLQWVPPGGGWSISQVFQHLATAHASYLAGIRGAIAADLASGIPREHEHWRPSFFGGMLIRSMNPSVRRGIPTPKIWRPASAQPTGSMDAFLGTQEAIAGLMHEGAEVDLVRARLSSPVSRFIRMNLGDAFRIFVTHDWRHLGQIRRVLDRDGFPAS